MDGKEEFRRNGEFYTVSPWALHFDDEKYYLVGYDMYRREMRHYRVDKMREVSTIEKNRKGATEYSRKHAGKYTQQHFRMYGGEVETVTLKCRKDMANVIVDQFGKGVRMIPVDDEYFKVNVDVAVSDQFFGWLLSLGNKVVLIEPSKVLKELKQFIKELTLVY